MNKNRGMNYFRILALILVMLFLPGCLGGKPQGTPAPSASATASGQVEPAAIAQTSESNTPLAEVATSTEAGTSTEVATSTSAQKVEQTSPTHTATPAKAAAVQAQAPTSTPVVAPAGPESRAQAGEVYEPIPGCAPSRMHGGDVIRISPEIEYVRIRSTPDTHPADNIIRRLYRSEVAQLTGRPVCNYGWILWPVQTADGTRGWVAESDGIDFWLVKANSWAFPTPTIQSR